MQKSLSFSDAPYLRLETTKKTSEFEIRRDVLVSVQSQSKDRPPAMPSLHLIASSH